MTKKIDNDTLRELYKHYGNARLVALHVSDTLGIKISERTVRHRLAKDKTTKSDKPKEKEEKPIAGGNVHAPDKERPRLEGKRFVFTAAQNNTYIHEDFFTSLLNFCSHRGAKLYVSQFSYNKSGFQNNIKESDDLWYDPRIADYVLNTGVKVADGLVFNGELDVLPTAVDPLSGFENYNQSSSGIIPHTKVQMKSLPRMKTEFPRFLYTTGAVTLRNYIQRKAGQKAEFHHVFGAIYVEIDDAGDWFVRQLIASEDGTFYDMTEKFTPKGVEEGHSVSTITWGDIHQEKLDPEVYEGSWGDNSILTTLNPDVQFVHDLTDFTARNHHNIRDPFFLAQMHHRHTGNVSADLVRSAQFLGHISRFGTKTVVVESNHDQALERWLREADIKTDPENAEYYHYASALIHQQIRLGNKRFSVYEHTLRKSGFIPDDRVLFLREDDSYVVEGVEHGMHGHRGPNGARGNPKGFRYVGRRVNIGHMHSAGIFDGVYVAGVSGRMDMDYNKGPSSWSHSHIVTYRSGKRTIITMKNGKWRA